MNKLWVGSDHAGVELKRKLLNSLPQDLQVKDIGTAGPESVDYPDFASQVCQAILREGGRGLLICGSGQGMNMRANRYTGIRSALCWNEETALLARSHNDANVLCLGSRMISLEVAAKCLEVFLSTPFEGGRHLNRVQKIDLPC